MKSEKAVLVIFRPADRYMACPRRASGYWVLVPSHHMIGEPTQIFRYYRTSASAFSSESQKASLLWRFTVSRWCFPFSWDDMRGKLNAFNGNYANNRNMWLLPPDMLALSLLAQTWLLHMPANSLHLAEKAGCLSQPDTNQSLLKPRPFLTSNILFLTSNI